MSLLSALLRPLESIRTVPIDHCYHYRGFRYGGFGNNPYEDYCVGLAQSRSIVELRATFADTVLNCRPRSFGEALQIELGDIPLWHFPWNHRRRSPSPDYIDDPHDNPDIMCHYCTKGVLASQINREFVWLEQAVANMRDEGYRPEARGYIRCLQLSREQRSSYLVLDGNHRLGALHALGLQFVKVAIGPLLRVKRETSGRWPRVRDGTFSAVDALRVFDRYFAERNSPLKRMNSAPLLRDEAPSWRTADA